MTDQTPAPTPAGSRPPVVALLVAMAFLTGAVGFAIGQRGDRSAAPGRDSVDVGFLYDMTLHHEQALSLSNVELMGGTEPRVTAFAREILIFQAREIGMMRRQLEVWGYDPEDAPEQTMGWMGRPFDAHEMPGLATDEELAALMDADGRDSDALFLALMIDHHRGGIHMAEAAAADAGDPFVRTLAERMARIQTTEIVEMEQARDALGLPASPAGYTADVMPHH